MTAPNPEQQALIDSTEGIHVVDAGPGTGKTFTITRRYATIVDEAGVDPDDVLLVTFTNNAATEMKDRIVGHCEYGMRDLADAPIQTFHSLCHDILLEHGFGAPTYLGIDDHITNSTRLLEDETVERSHFRAFIDRFAEDHPEHADRFRVLSDPTALLELLKNLASKGVFPTADGWYRNGKDALDGDFEAFRERFDELNQPRNDGNKQSKLRSKLGGFGREKCYLPSAPDSEAIRGDGTKQVPEEVARRVFEEDRADLKAFVHDVYHEYLAFALRRNYLNFSFLQLFAFVLLCERPNLREQIGFEYLMIDEFQDTSEIQFKLALLLAGTSNLCVVGDWKQSIYAFQYAAVENITDFERRLERFVGELNADEVRIPWETRPVTDHQLVANYRSTQSIIDISEQCLTTPAASNESVSVEDLPKSVTELSATTDQTDSTIEAIYHEDEYEALLTKIDEIVGNDAYQVRGEDGLRVPTYDDIAVLTRTRSFGRELLATAEAYSLPMAYEGGVELYRRDPAKLLLAWLRILESNGDRGWAVVLEEAGYTLDEIQYLLERADYPADLTAFREKLHTRETVGAVARQVFEQYGFDGPVAEVVLTTVQSVHDATTMTRGELISYIETGIERGTTAEVDASAGLDSVTVQTIHAAKGLEHPIVIMANMNSHQFPPTGGGSSPITFADPIGLRERKVYSEAHGRPHVYDNWKVDVLRTCVPRGNDEERRLLYVAVTRAESHLIFAAGESPNTFFEALPVEAVEYEPGIEDPGVVETEQTQLQIGVPAPDGPVGETPHTLMDESVFEEVEDGRGTAFGERVHEFAEAYVDGEVAGEGWEETDVEMDVDGDEPDFRNVVSLLDSLAGECLTEEEAYLPLTVEGQRVMVSGIVDLVHVTDETVEIIDYKTDLGRHAQDEYEKQVSVYYHVLSEWFSDREVTASLFYTHSGERVPVEPRSIDELEELVAGRLDESTEATISQTEESQ